MTLMHREIMEQPEVLGRLYEKNEAVLRALVEELNARGVTKAVFAGRGTSDNAAVFAQYALGVYRGVVSALALPSSMSAYGARLSLRDCLAAGFSQSGRATDALLVLEEAALQGAPTLAVTNDAASPMAKAAKYHLCCFAGEEKSVAATKTFTAQIYLAASLAALWGENRELQAALRRVPEQLAAFLAAPPDSLPRLAERFRYADDGFVLSRGFNYPVALECALKLNETCYMKIKAYSASDFYHGPLAQLDEKTPVVVLADGMIGQMMEAIEWRKPKERALPPKDWATDGTRGKRPHNIINSLYIDAKDCAVQNRKLQEKYDRITETEVRYEEFMAQDAEILFVAYGTTARIARAAVLKLRKDGVKAGLFRPVTLWPFPEKALRECAAHENVAAVIDVELSMGQMIDDVKIALAGAKPVRFVGMGGGAIPAPQELVDEAYKALGRCGK